MVFIVLASRVLATATSFGDRYAVAVRGRRRFVWLAGLVASALWPVIALAAAHLGDSALEHGLGLAGSGPRHLPWLLLPMPREIAPGWVDRLVAIAWGVASAILLSRLALFANAARRWRDTLPSINVDGTLARLSDQVGPVVSGIFGAEVIIPRWVLSLDQLERSLVLRHEVAHRDARDTYLLWLAAVLVALMPWNVLLWWQWSRLRLAIEIDCDARVIAELPHPVTYARMLIRLAADPGDHNSRRFPPVLALSRTRLEQRVAALSVPQRSSTMMKAAHLSIAVGAAVVALALRAPVTGVDRMAHVDQSSRLHAATTCSSCWVGNVPRATHHSADGDPRPAVRKPQ
ncbi:MAG: M56 family metallopeptidase [Gemmatimonadaceae bacterium]